MNEDTHADTEGVLEGVLAGLLAAAIAKMAADFLTRRYGPKSAKIYFTAVLISIIGAVVLFVLGVTVGYDLVMNPAVSEIWLWTCIIAALWSLPVTYALAVAERHTRSRR